MDAQTGWSELFHGPNHKWLVVGLLFFAGFLNLEDRVVVFSVLPLIKQDLRLSDVHLGALVVGFYRQSLGFQTVFGMVPLLVALAVSGLLLSFSRHLKSDLGRAMPGCRVPREETGGMTAPGNLTGPGE